jgi:hypothetical protein
MNTEQNKKAEEIIKLHKENDSHLNWDDLLDENFFVNYKELKIIQNVLLDKEFIKFLHPKNEYFPQSNEVTYLTENGEAFKGFEEAKEKKLENMSNAPTIITPILKDKVLEYLCSACQTEYSVSANTNEIVNYLEIDFDTFHSIMNQFQRLGLVYDLNLRRSAVFFILTVEANDLYLQGGFLAREELLENNIRKLVLEIDNLKKQLSPDLLDKAEKITSIASGILGSLSLFKK